MIVAEEIGIADEKIDGEGDTIDEDEMDILSASWAQHEDLIPLYCQNTYIDSKNVTIDVYKNHKLSVEETSIQMKLKGERSIHRSELLMQSRKIQYLANLAYGIEWVLDQIKYLRDSGGKKDSSIIFSTRKVISKSKVLMILYL